MAADNPSRTFIFYEDGRRCELAYHVRLLKDLSDDSDAIVHRAGEELAMNADEAVHALARGYGQLLGDIVDGLCKAAPVWH